MSSVEKDSGINTHLESGSFAEKQALCKQVIQALSREGKLTDEDILALKKAEDDLTSVLAGEESGLANLADYGSYVGAKGSYFISMLSRGKIPKRDLHEVFSGYRENIRKLRTGEEVEKPVLEEIKGLFEANLETLKKAEEYSKQLFS